MCLNLCAPYIVLCSVQSLGPVLSSSSAMQGSFMTGAFAAYAPSSREMEPCHVPDDES